MKDQNSQFVLPSETGISSFVHHLNNKHRRPEKALGQKEKEGRGSLSLEHGGKSTQLQGGGCCYRKDDLLLEKEDKYSCVWRKRQILSLIYNW